MNDTCVYVGDVNCTPNGTQNFCLTTQGGNFVEANSSTFQSIASRTSFEADTTVNVTSSPPDWGQDTFTLASNVSIPNFPIALTPSTAYFTPNSRAAIGLGSNSTLLSRLIDTGIIGSRTWGLWWGLAGSAQAVKMDGSLILGGYDAAKIKFGQNYTGIIDESNICPSGMTVTTASIVLSFPNGSNLNLLDPLYGSSELSVCLCPQCPILMSIKYDP